MSKYYVSPSLFIMPLRILYLVLQDEVLEESNVIFHFFNRIFHARGGKFGSGGLWFFQLLWFKIVLCDGTSIQGQVSIQMGYCLEVLGRNSKILIRLFSICVLPDFREIRLQWQLIYFSMTYPLGQDLIGTLNTVVSSTSECHAISSILSLFCPKLPVKELRQVTGCYLPIYFVGCQLTKNEIPSIKHF